MFGVFQNIDPPPPLIPWRVAPRLWCGGRGEDTLARGRRGGGRGVNSSEDARRCSVLYIRKYFVCCSFISGQEHFLRQEMFGALKKAFQVLLNGLPLDIHNHL
jgi:hypothetical protein